MADISIKEAQAKQWVDEVNAEIDRVKVILQKVTEASIAVPGEDDTIMNGIESTCRNLENAWKSMFDRFKQASGKMMELIELLAREARELEEKARSIGQK